MKLDEFVDKVLEATRGYEVDITLSIIVVPVEDGSIRVAQYADATDFNRITFAIKVEKKTP